MSNVIDINSKQPAKQINSTMESLLLGRVRELEDLLELVILKLKITTNPDLNTTKLLIDDIENAL